MASAAFGPLVAFRPVAAARPDRSKVTRSTRRNDQASSRTRRTLASVASRERSAKAARSASPTEAICVVFGRYCAQALAVAHCESRYDTGAQNGQYLGLFQMGSWERRTYGHGSGAYDQAIAAYRYFAASGRDWSPWSCKPW